MKWTSADIDARRARKQAPPQTITKSKLTITKKHIRPQTRIQSRSRAYSLKTGLIIFEKKNTMSEGLAEGIQQDTEKTFADSRNIDSPIQDTQNMNPLSRHSIHDTNFMLSISRIRKRETRFTIPASFSKQGRGFGIV